MSTYKLKTEVFMQKTTSWGLCKISITLMVMLIIGLSIGFTSCDGLSDVYSPASGGTDSGGDDGTTATKIYIADTGNNRIVSMDDMSGTGWTTLAGLTSGSGTNQFLNPRGIFVR